MTTPFPALRRGVLLLAALLLASLAVACNPFQQNSIDRQFIDMMVPHHQAAVAMAEIALERSQRPEIRGMAQDILRTQQTEIDQMKGWRQAWYGSSQTPPMTAMPMLPGMEDHGSMAGMSGMGSSRTMDMTVDINRLRTAQEPFDIAFIDLMIPHHQDAIDAARILQRQSTRPEMQALAQEIINAQLKEIDEMRIWRQAWTR